MPIGSTMLPDLVRLRGPLAEDHNFLRSSWLRSYRALYTIVPNESFFRVHGQIVEGLLRRPATRVVVACAKDDEAQIIGYAVAAPSERVVHWGYVKSSFRQMGIGRACVESALDGLAPGATIVVTHTLPDSVRDKVVRHGWTIRPLLAAYMGLGAELSSAAWADGADRDRREREERRADRSRRSPIVEAILAEPGPDPAEHEEVRRDQRPRRAS